MTYFYFSQDDIAHIATPPGNAPVGVIRISGPRAFQILEKNIQGNESELTPEHKTIERKTIERETIERETKRAVVDCRFALRLKTTGRGNGRRQRFLCPARVFFCPAPASYTTEDVAEIHLPGSMPLLNAALAGIVAAGARLALPGEFTFRAFRGGRLTLGQAEAVQEIVRAENDAEKRRALQRLGDARQNRIRQWRERLLDSAALVEAALDFSEEEIEESAAGGIGAIVRELHAAAVRMGDSVGDCEQGGGLPDIALVGLANAGKSSLLNALLGDDAVIVSPEASTTRDALKREVYWNGAGFVLSDNPGFDPGGAGVGAVAAERAFGKIGGHDLPVWVVDASVPAGDRLEEFARALTGAVVVVLNKTDLPIRTDERAVREIADRHGLAVAAMARVSARDSRGIDGLRKLLAESVRLLKVAGPWSRREAWELGAAADCCRAALSELSEGGRLELVADDLRWAERAFSRALGEGYAEEALARIFSRFCIGK